VALFSYAGGDKNVHSYCDFQVPTFTPPPGSVGFVKPPRHAPILELQGFLFSFDQNPAHILYTSLISLLAFQAFLLK
jgi:hypothetical protein